MTAAVTWLWRLLALLALVAVAQAQDAKPLKGVALVIGQSKYEFVSQLDSPKKDARDVEQLLDRLGFKPPTSAIDRTAKQLQRDIDGFIEDVEGADVAVVYYSGHGVQSAGENYLVPTDITFVTLDTMISVSDILKRLETRAKIVIVLLDACRDNPFSDEVKGAKLSGKGLAALTGNSKLGQVIGFGAEPGSFSLDGEPGTNSYYTAALLKHMSAKGVEFGDVMTMVQQEVYLTTGGKQVPWTNTSLRKFLFFGGTAEEETGDEGRLRAGRRELLLTIAATPEDLRRTVETLAAKDNLPLGPLYGMLKQLQVDTSKGRGELDKQLAAGAANLKKLMAERETIARSDPEIIRLTDLGDRAQAEGAIPLALEYRAKASAKAAELSRSLKDVEAQLKARHLEVAATFAKEAETATLAFDYRKAAEKYGQAVAEVARWDRNAMMRYAELQGFSLADHALQEGWRDATRAWAYGDTLEIKLSRLRSRLRTLDSNKPELTEAQAFRARELEESVLNRATYDEWTATDAAPQGAREQYIRGDLQRLIGWRGGGTAWLVEAVAAHRAELEDFTREREPQRWAKTLNDLVTAHQLLGETEGPTVRLEAAVAAYDELLKQWTRENAPLDWALVKYNLGNTLRALGEREKGTARLEAAIAAYGDALEEWTRERVPFNWATAQNDLGVALSTLAEREKGTSRLEAAVAAYGEAVTERTRERVPLQWAMTQNNLAATLRRLGERQGNRTHLEDAAVAGGAALKILTPEHMPLQWATAQNNLGNALAALGEREEGTARFAAAATAYGEALKVWTRARWPLDWAKAHHNRGNVLRSAGERQAGSALLVEAAAEYRAALDVWTREGSPIDWARTQHNLGLALMTLGGRESGMAWLEDAVTAYRAAHGGYQAADQPANAARMLNSAGFALVLMGERSGGVGRFSNAVPILREALATQQKLGDREAPLTADSLCRALLGLGSRTKDRAALIEAKALCTSALAGEKALGADWAVKETVANLENVEKALRETGAR